MFVITYKYSYSQKTKFWDYQHLMKPTQTIQYSTPIRLLALRALSVAFEYQKGEKRE